MLSFISVVIFSSFSCVWGQQLSDFYGVAHLDHAEELIQKVFQRNNLFVAEDYFSALKLQNLTSPDKLSCGCDFLAKIHFSSEDMNEAFYGEEINKLCQCGLKVVDIDSHRLEALVEVI
jgi:hypothetical protein